MPVVLHPDGPTGPYRPSAKKKVLKGHYEDLMRTWRKRLEARDWASFKTKKKPEETTWDYEEQCKIRVRAGRHPVTDRLRDILDAVVTGVPTAEPCGIRAGSYRVWVLNFPHAAVLRAFQML
ncbi:hypothetical protein Tco_1448905 [Tanacetum coccineum]